MYKPGMRVYHEKREVYGILIKKKEDESPATWNVKVDGSGRSNNWYEHLFRPSSFENNKEASILLSEEK